MTISSNIAAADTTVSLSSRKGLPQATLPHGSNPDWEAMSKPVGTDSPSKFSGDDSFLALDPFGMEKGIAGEIRSREVRATTNTPSKSVQEYDVEMILDQRVFGESPDTRFRLARGQCVKLGLNDDKGTISVIGWGIEVPVADRSRIPRYIARRFLELFSAGMERRLEEQDEACLARISDQVDYRSFVANRRRPIYREATLHRHGHDVRLEFLTDRTVKVPAPIAAVLADLDDGDRFGAYFGVDAQEAINHIANIVLLPPVAESFAEMESRPKHAEVEFPDSLKHRLPTFPEPKE